MKDKIIELLIKAYWKELETVQNYLANSVNLDGVSAEEIKEALVADITEELTHAQTLAKRIKEIGGKVPGSFEFKAEQKGLQPPEDSTNVVAVIKGVIEAEEDAIRTYNEIIKLCDGNDYVTQDIAISLLANEESHHSKFVGFLKEYTK